MKYLCALLGTLALAGCISINSDVIVPDGETVESISTVNGSISVGVGSIVEGEITTVNGSVKLASRGQADDITTVNGKIELAAEAVTGSLETVNGSIQVGERCAIDGGVETVNGRITLGAETVVSGKVSAINGQLMIRGAEVGRLENVNGGMVLESGTVVNGELRVRKPRMADEEPVTIEIHADVRVVGPLVFERPVTLRVHERAEVGEIEGAEPVYFND